MAFVMKWPSEASPGVVIFTHKERRFFERPSSALGTLIKRATQEFLFGMHWGHYAADVVPAAGIDFHLAGPGTLHFAAGHSAPRIALCSRNFAPVCFAPDGRTKFWDVMMVARPLRLKHIDQFFQVWKKVLAARPSSRALLVCPEIPNPNPAHEYVEMVTDYKASFTESERKNITLLLTSSQLYPFPLEQETIAFLYNSSRFFALFSEQEGESRVISEALLCGLPVIVRHDLRGGGRDYLTEQNSFQFHNLDEAAKGILALLDGRMSRSVDVEAVAQALREDNSSAVLRRELAEIFAAKGFDLNGPIDLIGLNRKLPGHYVSLPPEIRMDKTDDIRDVVGFKLFMHFLAARGNAAVTALSPASRLVRFGDRARAAVASAVATSRRLLKTAVTGRSAP